MTTMSTSMTPINTLHSSLVSSQWDPREEHINATTKSQASRSQDISRQTLFSPVFLDKEIVKVFSKIFRMRGPLKSSVKSREWKRFWFVDCFQSFLPLGSKSCVCYLSKENLLNIYNYQTHTYTKVIFDIVCPVFPWRVQSQFDDLYHCKIYIYKETVILTDHTKPIMPCLQKTFSSVRATEQHQGSSQVTNKWFLLFSTPAFGGPRRRYHCWINPFTPIFCYSAWEGHDWGKLFSSLSVLQNLASFY